MAWWTVGALAGVGLVAMAAGMVLVALFVRAIARADRADQEER
ncbi:hypothetical protein [Streptomyces avicenniae]|nr:hypothetical protein [Streptomyces avicenniae]